MAKKPKRVDLPSDHPFIRMGFVHELDIIEAFGLTWSTWERDYRTRIPGRTSPNGRWYQEADFLAWWAITKTSTLGADSSK